MPTTSAPTNAYLDLDQLTSHIAHITQALEHKYRHRVSLNNLKKALQQAQQVEIWTGKEPPRLRAVEAVIAQCQRVLGGPTHTSDPRRDSARGSLLGKTSTHDAELATLESHACQCTILVQKLNFATILITACNDSEGLRSSIVNHKGGDNELVSIIEQLVKLQYSSLRVESRSLQTRANGTSAATAASDSASRAWIEGLARWAGLQLQSDRHLTTRSLSSLASMEYRKAVLSIETNAVREEAALPNHAPALLPARPVFEDCYVTIKLSGHEDVSATRFEMSEGQCMWFDDQGLMVLTHKFRRLCTDLHPWRHPLQHSSLTVAFTEHAIRGCSVSCANSRHDEHKEEAPDYVFEDAKGYATFQSCLRARNFVTEYEVASIKTQTLEKSPAQLVKIWRHPLTRSASVTLPLAVRASAGYHIRHEEIEVSKFHYEKLGIKSARLTVKQNREQTDGNSPLSSTPSGKRSRSFSLLKHPFNTLLRVASAELQAVASPPLERRYYTLEFRSSNDRDEFAKLFAIVPASVPFSATSALSDVPTADNTSLPALRFESLASSPVFPSLTMISSSTSGAEDLRRESSNATDLQDAALPEPFAHDLLRQGGPKLPLRVTAPTQHGTAYHQPLSSNGEFRILRIVQGTEPRLCCYLDHYDLAHPPKYEALSYCWGGGSDKLYEISSGDLCGFRVSEHLWRALWRLRLPNHDRLVWIDAICINQANIDEKNDQISLMRQIYTAAFRTIIWIGDLEPQRRTCPRCESDEDASDLTLCTLQDLSALEHDNVFDGLVQELIELKEHDDKTGQAKVWWKRLWCVQEFYYSARTPSVYIGPHAIGWKHFQSLFDAENNPLSLFQRRPEGEQATLSGLLSKTGGFLCSDPRDRVFALLGMIDQASLTFDPDYRHSVIRVLEDSCVYLLAQTKSLDVLLDKRTDRTCWGRNAVPRTMPTWMPDLTCLLQEGSVRGPDGYKAGLINTNQFNNHAKSLTTELSGEQTWTIDGFRYDIPRTLLCEAVYFDTIIKRTTCHDIPDFEKTPDGCLIYNSLEKRGYIIDRILNTLEYDFKTYEDYALQHDLDVNPGIGRLMLDYLFHGERSTVEEIERIAKGPKRDIITAYAHQRQQDLDYLSYESKTREVSNDKRHVKERYRTKLERAEAEKIFIPERFRSAYNSENRSIQRDFNVARDIGNLFAYARTSGQRYYLTRDTFDAPMRRDVLECKTMAEVELLPTQFLTRGEGLQFHEYVEHHRERDFFRTSNGFLGLGPSSLQEGDGIVVPLGASRPFILRRSENGTHYTLVGSAVVPGIMSGKWLKFQGHTAKKYAIR